MSTASRDLRTSGDLVMAPRVPHGLAAAVEGLTREVIRHRPEDIYVFAAQHFEELLKLRDEYGAVTNLPGKSANTAALREMNQALKKRSGTEKGGGKPAREKGGWSMNETARVLERHRSIFGDKGKKVSPDEVRALGNEKENKTRRKNDLEKFANSTSHKRRGSNERFVKKKYPPKDQEQQDNKSKSDSNGNPKIISQIPTLTQSTGLLAKDIKSELRKNRNSSRDGKSIRERAEKKNSERTERYEIGARQSGATRKTLMRSSNQRSLDKLNDSDDVFSDKIVTDNQKQKTDQIKGFSKSLSKIPRTLSMDRVREFVVEKFQASESWEELRSTNYVDRVQEVIDEASPTILRKVKELSVKSAGRNRGYESVDESTSTSTRSDKSNQTDDVRSRSAMSVSRRSKRSGRLRSKSKSKSKSKNSCADSLEGIETLASETEQINETGNEIEIGKIRKKGNAKNSANGFISGESDASDYNEHNRKASASSSISLPAVRPPSSKNQSRNVSHSDSDNLVLPPIPPEVPKSAKYREELVLPSLQITKEHLRGVESPGVDDPVLIQDNPDFQLNLPDAPTEEIFRDSLNVTPDIAASPRPDSLEPDATRVKDSESGDNIAELKSQLNEMSSQNDIEVEEGEGNAGMKEQLKEIEEAERRIEKILRNETQETRDDSVGGKSVEEKLIEIQEAEKQLRDILDPSVSLQENENLEALGSQKDGIDPGIKEKLIEIEESEKRIEKIFDSGAQKDQEDQIDDGMKEKLMEIEETEKRIEKIFDSGAQKVQEDQIDDGMKEKLIEIEETEKRIEKIFDSGAQKIQEDQIDDGMKDKLMEIEETEKRIEKIFDSGAQEVQKDKIDDGMKKKLLEIEETEKRIEKILDPQAQEVQKQANDFGMKEKIIEIEEIEKRIGKMLDPELQEDLKSEKVDEVKKQLMEIEVAEKRIEQILQPEVSQLKDDEPDACFTKDKLMAIEEAEKLLKNVLDSTPVDGEKDNLDLNGSVEQNNSAPKTPFIPEIPSEYVTTANQERTIQEDEVKGGAVTATDNNQFIERSAKPGDTEKEFTERNETRILEIEAKIEQFSSETPDSLGNSYVLTEGSPYEIPDSVTTVIIPERQLDTPSSDILEIVLEDDPGTGSRTFHAVGTKLREKSPEEGNCEISLRNILDNFGEIVHQEGVAPSSPVDVDFIKILKTSNDVIIPRKDLGLITEEDDKDFTEIDVAEMPRDPVTPILHDIAESEETVELNETQNSSSDTSNAPEDEYHTLRCDDEKVEGERALEIEKLASSRTSKHEEVLEEAANPERANSLNPEDRNPESVDNHTLSGDRKTRSLETVEHEVTSPTTTAIGSLQQIVTDSATTESTDEVKETTISDDGGNTAAESSVTSPSCGEDVGARNSESSNEVKETTISDQPADEIGKNLFSLVPQCHGSMPHVPELNLDSLQDITVSSFQLSDDATPEEDSDVGQSQSENDVSKTTATTADNLECQEHEPVHEELIVKEKVLIEEDPCEKVTAYVTEPNTENSDPKTPHLDSVSIKQETDISEEVEVLPPEKDTENVATEKSQDITDDVTDKTPEKEPEEVHDKMAQDVNDKVLAVEAEDVHDKTTEDVGNKIPVVDLEEAHEKKPEGEPEEVIERVVEKEREEIIGKVNKEPVEEEPNEVYEEVSRKVDQEIPENIREELTQNPSEKGSEEVPEKEATGVLETLPEVTTKNLPEKNSGVKAKQVSEEAMPDVAEKVPEEAVSDAAGKVPAEVHEEVVKDSAQGPHEQSPENGANKEPEDLESRSLICSELDTTSLKDFKELEASVGEEYPKDIILEYVEEETNLEKESRKKVADTLENIESASTSNSVMRVLPEVAVLTNPEEITKTSEPLIASQSDSAASTNLNPPRAEVVTNDLDEDNDENHGEKTEYHIYVPEVTASDECSTTESSTFNSAATKIQAGVRGFLTRRRLQSAQRRSSTLDSVPSIPDSSAADGPHLEPIEEVGLAQAATTIQSNYRGYKARQRLRREDAVQKTTMSVENVFCGNGLQHTGEFHDCLPLPPYHHDKDHEVTIARDDQDTDVCALRSEEKEELDANDGQENREWVTESTTTKEESVVDQSTFGLLVSKYPYAHHGLNLVVLTGNDAVLQSQYLNFITSIEEAHNETDSLLPGNEPPRTADGFSTLKSNAGIESLPLDNPDTDISIPDSSVSLREPLAVPGSPTALIIEELSKTDEEMSIPADVTSVSSTNNVKTGTNLDNEEVSQLPDDSLDLPGLSLEVQPEKQVPQKFEGKEQSLETHNSKDLIQEPLASSAPDVPPQDASLGTMSFSMNVDDMLGLGAESDSPPSKVKPIFEVTVTPRDLLKLTNRSHGSQASGDRVESPVTMMQIVPKSVEDKSDRSEDEREISKVEINDGRKKDEINHPVNVLVAEDNKEKIHDGTIIADSSEMNETEIQKTPSK